MLIIDQDPRVAIPNISESDFEKKMILVSIKSRSFDNHYIDMVIKEGTLFQWKGQCITKSRFFISGSSQSLVELLCNVWKDYIDQFDVKIYVLDSFKELSQVLNTILEGAH